MDDNLDLKCINRMSLPIAIFEYLQHDHNDNDEIVGSSGTLALASAHPFSDLSDSGGRLEPSSRGAIKFYCAMPPTKAAYKIPEVLMGYGNREKVIDVDTAEGKEYKGDNWEVTKQLLVFLFLGDTALTVLPPKQVLEKADPESKKDRKKRLEEEAKARAAAKAEAKLEKKKAKKAAKRKAKGGGEADEDEEKKPSKKKVNRFFYVRFYYDKIENVPKPLLKFLDMVKAASMAKCNYKSEIADTPSLGIYNMSGRDIKSVGKAAWVWGRYFARKFPEFARHRSLSGVILQDKTDGFVGTRVISAVVREYHKTQQLEKRYDDARATVNCQRHSLNIIHNAIRYVLVTFDTVAYHIGAGAVWELGELLKDGEPTGEKLARAEKVKKRIWSTILRSHEQPTRTGMEVRGRVQVNHCSFPTADLHKLSCLPPLIYFYFYFFIFRN